MNASSSSKQVIYACTQTELAKRIPLPWSWRTMQGLRRGHKQLCPKSHPKGTYFSELYLDEARKAFGKKRRDK
jgi:hypothetical protein